MHRLLCASRFGVLRPSSRPGCLRPASPLILLGGRPALLVELPPAPWSRYAVRMKLINRTAVIVRPKALLLEWAASTDADAQDHLDIIQDRVAVYLVDAAPHEAHPRLGTGRCVFDATGGNDSPKFGLQELPSPTGSNAPIMPHLLVRVGRMNPLNTRPAN